MASKDDPPSSKFSSVLSPLLPLFLPCLPVVTSTSGYITASFSSISFSTQSVPQHVGSPSLCLQYGRLRHHHQLYYPLVTMGNDFNQLNKQLAKREREIALKMAALKKKKMQENYKELGMVPQEEKSAEYDVKMDILTMDKRNIGIALNLHDERSSSALERQKEIEKSIEFVKISKSKQSSPSNTNNDENITCSDIIINENENGEESQSEIETENESKNESENPIDYNKAKYKPKVSTWGVFERPDDISKAYGGGKNLPPGGVNIYSDEALKKREETKRQLDEYRKSLGIDVVKEEHHRAEVELALERHLVYMQNADPVNAIKVLENVTSFVAPMSLLGGNVYLNLAMAYEAMGKEEEAKNFYGQLLLSPHREISTKAKDLAFGMEAMHRLNQYRDRNLRVMQFNLPDFNKYTKRRYDTTYGAWDILQEQKEAEGRLASPLQLDKQTQLILAFLAAPLAFFLVLVIVKNFM